MSPTHPAQISRKEPWQVLVVCPTGVQQGQLPIYIYFSELDSLGCVSGCSSVVGAIFEPALMEMDAVDAWEKPLRGLQSFISDTELHLPSPCV